MVSSGSVIAPPALQAEPLDCENVREYVSAGLALNPFGTESDLDSLIFEGFRPHDALKSKW